MQNAPPGFWSTSSGIEFGEQLCAYVGGSVRGVGVIQTHEILEVYSSVLRRELVSSKPTSAPLSKFRASRAYWFDLFLYSKPSPGLGLSGSLNQALRAMEKGNWEAFRRHRQQEMHSVKNVKIGSQTSRIEAGYKHDSDEWKQELNSDAGR